MKCLNQIDAQQVGSICIDSNSYLSISDMFKMNNRVSDICKILSGKRTFVGKLRNDDSKSIAVKSAKLRTISSELQVAVEKKHIRCCRIKIC